MKRQFISKEYKELLLSHHPDLPCFKDDVIVLFGRRVCAGCLLGYPTAFCIILFFHPYGPDSIGISLFYALLSQLRRVSGDTPHFNNYCRFLAGIALGFGMGGFYWALFARQWIYIIILAIGGTLYYFVRVYYMKMKIMNYKRS